MKVKSPAKVVHRESWVHKPLRGGVLKVTAVFVLLVFTTMVLHGNWRLAGVLIAGGFCLWLVVESIQERRWRAVLLRHVETMEEEEFLRFMTELLRSQGYGVLKASQAVTSGIDLLTMRGEDNFACRLLRHRCSIRRADIIATLHGMKDVGCGRGMIVSTGRVTVAARRLAQRTECVVLDRDALAHLISQYQQGHRVFTFPREEADRLRKRK